MDKNFFSSVKLSCYINIVWGVLVGFCVIGILLGKHQAIVMAIITCLGWTMLKIVKEAAASIEILSEIRTKNIEEK
jgi:hypothetical protein